MYYPWLICCKLYKNYNKRLKWNYSPIHAALILVILAQCDSRSHNIIEHARSVSATPSEYDIRADISHFDRFRRPTRCRMPERPSAGAERWERCDTAVYEKTWKWYGNDPSWWMWNIIKRYKHLGSDVLQRRDAMFNIIACTLELYHLMYTYGSAEWVL